MNAWLIPVIIAAVLVVVFIGRRVFLPRGGSGDEIRSVVLMRRTQLTLTEARARAIIERALGDRPEIVFLPLPARDDGAQMHGFLRDGEAYGLISVPRPYVSEEFREEARKTIRDPEILRGLTEHTAWVSVDVMRGGKDVARASATICRVIAELIDDEAMLLYDVKHQRMAKIDDKTRTLLAGPAPMLIFGGDDMIVNVEADDEALAEATRTAQSRLDEFRIAWANREEDQHFAVKAPFVDGKETEHMWVTVTDMEDGTVTGTLDSEPQVVRTVATGQRVTLRNEEIEDWIIADPSGRMTGGFSINMLLGRKMG